MLFLCLSRESSDQSCAKCDIRNLTSKLLNGLDELRSGSPSSHSLQDTIACMLDREIQIMADLLLLFHGLDQFIVNFLRIAVKHADPADSFDLA